MATSFAFSFAARCALELRPSTCRLRFWAGIACGLATQGALLLASAGSVRGWVSLLLVGVAAIGVFYLVRVIFGMLSPEEEQLLQRLAGRQRQAGKL